MVAGKERRKREREPMAACDHLLPENIEGITELRAGGSHLPSQLCHPEPVAQS